MTLSYTKEYGIVIFCGMPFYVVSNMLSSVIRADGSPKFALIAMFSGAILNIVFDPILIFAFDMGVLGAAIATIAGQIVSCIIALIYLGRTKTFTLRKSSFRFNPSAILVMLPLGISSFLTQVTIVLTSAVSNAQMSGYGAESVYGADIPVAVNGIIMKVFAICVSIAIGLVVGAQPILGFNFGACNYSRVKKTFNLVTVITVIVCAVATVMFECFPTSIIKLFGEDDPLYIEFAVSCFRIYLSLIIFTCFQKISGVFLQALGQPVKSIIVSVCRDLVFLVPLMFILPPKFGINGVLYSGPAADILAFIVTIIFISVQMYKLGHYNEKGVIKL